MQKAYIIAEIGFNHEGEMDLAKRMIRLAAESGADAVKFQTYQACDLALPSAPHFELISGGELSEENFRDLKRECDKVGVEFLSTPFSLEATEMLERIGVNAFKVASMDCFNRLLLKKIASTGKPIYISTGMANYGEIRSLVEFLEKEEAGPVTVLHCISKYPSVKEDLQLGVIPALKDALGKPVGYSDHYPGNKACIVAISLGANVIETHFTDDTSREGGDHHHSCNPESLKELVDFARTYPVMAEGGLDSLENRSDREFAPAFRRGVYAKSDLPAGTVLTVDNLLFCRPESELSPNDEILGKKLKTSVQAEESIRAGNLED